MCLNLKQISFKWYLVGFCFLIHCVNLSFLLCVFRPFIVKAVIDMVKARPFILLFVFCLLPLLAILGSHFLAFLWVTQDSVLISRQRVKDLSLWSSLGVWSGCHAHAWVITVSTPYLFEWRVDAWLPRGPLSLLHIEM